MFQPNTHIRKYVILWLMRFDKYWIQLSFPSFVGDTRPCRTDITSSSSHLRMSLLSVASPSPPRFFDRRPDCREPVKRSATACRTACSNVTLISDIDTTSPIACLPQIGSKSSLVHQTLRIYMLAYYYNDARISNARDHDLFLCTIPSATFNSRDWVKD